MARKKTNKAQAVRDYMAAHPAAGPSEIAKALKKLGVTAKYVSVIRYTAKQKSAKSGDRRSHKTAKLTSAGSAPASHDSLIAAARFIKACGGNEEAKTALAIASKILDAA